MSVKTSETSSPHHVRTWATTALAAVATGALVLAGTTATAAPASSPDEVDVVPSDALVEVSSDEVALHVSEAFAADDEAETLEVMPGVESEAGVLVPIDGSAPIELAAGEGTLAISLPTAEGVDVEVTASGDVVVPSENEGSTLLLQEVDTTDLAGVGAGFRALITMESRDVDPLYTFELDLPDGGILEFDDEGNVLVLSADDELVSLVGPAWAVDAAGRHVDTWYEIEGDTLLQYVDHLAAEYSYPIVADPVWFVPLAIGARIVVRAVVANSARSATSTAIATATRGAAGATVRLASNAVVRTVTARNARVNLITWSSRSPGSRCDAHHTLPQRYRGEFWGAGFKGADSIDHPRYLVWWEKSDHRSKAGRVNGMWEQFWRDRAPARTSKTTILNHRTTVLRAYPPRCP